MTKFVLNEKGERIIYMTMAFVLFGIGIFIFIDFLKNRKKLGEDTKKALSEMWDKGFDAGFDVADQQHAAVTEFGRKFPDTIADIKKKTTKPPKTRTKATK